MKQQEEDRIAKKNGTDNRTGIAAEEQDEQRRAAKVLREKEKEDEKASKKAEQEKSWIEQKRLTLSEDDRNILKNDDRGWKMHETKTSKNQMRRVEGRFLKILPACILAKKKE